jgi:hypothetical protein
VPLGTEVTLHFASSFEPYLTLGGTRVLDDTGGDARELLLWVSRRLPAMWRALEDRCALRAVLVSGHDTQIVVTDLVATDRDDNVEWFDHGMLRERLEAANVLLARFSLLGALSTKAELERRVRATYAPGTLVEVRVEDGRRVASRRRLRVGR